MSNKELTKDQIEKISLLTTSLASTDLSPSERIWLTKGNTCKRYLVAHKWNSKSALDGINSTILWRRQTKPDCISLRQEALDGNIYLNGTCKNNR
jgi:CRAL/TRIO, N-terminal domain